MKYKLFIITFTVFLFICIAVKAEDIINNNNPNKCKTMQDGICTEYYSSVNYDAQIQEPPKQDMRFLDKREQNRVCGKGFGFQYVLDSYNSRLEPFVGFVNDKSKIYIIDITNNSSASRAGLKMGDEILKINDIKIEKFKSSDFDNYLDGQQNIKLDIKSVSGDKKSITLSREEICTTYQMEPFFESYWGQVCSYDLDSASKYLSYIGRVSNKLTPQFKRGYNSWQNELNGWYNKKSQFRKGFDLCLSNNYNMPDVNNCLNQLVNRSLNNIANEQNLENQRSAIQLQQQQVQVQQQMQQQQINALNNYSDALRNQHVNVNQNVYHSGTVNHDVNVNGTYYHYRY